MTNKEYLSTLSAEEWFIKIGWLFKVYGKSYTDSHIAIIEWLNKEHEEEQMNEKSYTD